jgi:hypothetical protein
LLVRPEPLKRSSESSSRIMWSMSHLSSLRPSRDSMVQPTKIFTHWVIKWPWLPTKSTLSQNWKSRIRRPKRFSRIEFDSKIIKVCQINNNVSFHL